MDGGETLEHIVGELRGCGYVVSTKLFDAKGWVPQSRRRIYFVGFRDDIAETTGAAERFEWPDEPETCGGTVEDVIEDENDELYRNINRAAAACEVSKYQMERSDAFFRRRQRRRRSSSSSSSSTTISPRHPRYQYLSAEEGVARTLCASYRKSSVYNAELVPPPVNDADDDDDDDDDEAAEEEGRVRRRRRRRRPRYYTVREAARLQGFPETFHPDPERGYHELGNAVVPPLVRSVGAAVLEALSCHRL